MKFRELKLREKNTPSARSAAPIPPSPSSSTTNSSAASSRRQNWRQYKMAFAMSVKELERRGSMPATTSSSSTCASPSNTRSRESRVLVGGHLIPLNELPKRMSEYIPRRKSWSCKSGGRSQRARNSWPKTASPSCITWPAGTTTRSFLEVLKHSFPPDRFSANRLFCQLPATCLPPAAPATGCLSCQYSVRWPCENRGFGLPLGSSYIPGFLAMLI